MAARNGVGTVTGYTELDIGRWRTRGRPNDEDFTQFCAQEARVLAAVYGWASKQWTMFACVGLGIAARAGSASLPMPWVGVILAAASASATLVLVDAWARDPDDIRRGSTRAIAAATWCAFSASMAS